MSTASPKCRFCGRPWLECQCLVTDQGEVAERPQGEKAHLSPSAVEMLSKCGEQYRRRYIEGDIIPPGVAMLRGRAVHRGAEMNFRQKIESRADLPVKDVVDAAVAAFDGDWSGGVQLSDDEAKVGMAKIKGQAIDTVVSLSSVFHVERACEIQPLRVEEGFRIELDGPHDVKGFLDLYGLEHGASAAAVYDLKTAAKSKTQADADSSFQLTVYGAAACLLEKRQSVDVSLEVAVATKVPKVQTLRSRRDASDFSILRKRIEVSSRAVLAGNFLPAPSGAFYCSKRWCGYWSSCEFTRHDV